MAGSTRSYWHWLEKFVYRGGTGTIQYWFLTVLTLGVGLELEIYYCWARELETFQRSGAVLTAILVPMFSFQFSRIAQWSAWKYAEQAKLEAKKMTAWRDVYQIQLRGAQVNDELLESTFKLEAHETDIRRVDTTLTRIGPAAFSAFALFVTLSTLVWGFGDLLYQESETC